MFYRIFQYVVPTLCFSVGWMSCYTQSKHTHVVPIKPKVAFKSSHESKKVFPSNDGRLNSYVAFAMKNSPELRAAFETWRAEQFESSGPGALPNPTINFGYFVRSVETRTGPQRYKIGVSQVIPWPTKRSAREQASELAAGSSALAVDDALLSLKRSIVHAYWDLWLIEEQHQLNQQHDALLDSLSKTIRGRLKTGNASLADASQVELKVARHHDHLGGYDQRKAKAVAAMLSALGATETVEIPKVDETPILRLPELSKKQMFVLLDDVPKLKRLEVLSESKAKLADAKRATGYPDFIFGLQWIGIEDSAPQTVVDSGQDAWMVSAGISLPLWRGRINDAQAAAKAHARSYRSRMEAAKRVFEEQITIQLATIRDTHRQALLFEGTLIPQAETTFEAVLGSIQTGSANTVTLLLAEQDLIDLKHQLANIKANHEKSWATLEALVGTPLASKEQG